ncbi:MAG: hypothetical protein LKE36_00665 [Bacilli bacterium]|jgi:hypothetical protein|nr:hypothetical protein [Bacilli bacterium]
MDVQILKNNVKDFASKLYDIYFSNYESTNLIEYFPKELPRQMLKHAKVKDELVFLHNNKNFTPTYINQLVRYPNGRHILDNELEIESRILEIDSKIGDYIDYDFIDSKNDAYVQLSDSIVSIIAIILSFLEYDNEDETCVFVKKINLN